MPFVETRAEQVRDYSTFYFELWCSRSIYFKVMQAGKNFVDDDISIDSPAGVFIKFKLENMTIERAKNNKVVLGLVICKREEGQAASGGKP